RILLGKSVKDDLEKVVRLFFSGAGNVHDAVGKLAFLELMCQILKQCAFPHSRWAVNDHRSPFQQQILRQADFGISPDEYTRGVRSRDRNDRSWNGRRVLPGVNNPTLRRTDFQLKCVFALNRCMNIANGGVCATEGEMMVEIPAEEIVSNLCRQILG